MKARLLVIFLLLSLASSTIALAHRETPQPFSRGYLEKPWSNEIDKLANVIIFFATYAIGALFLIGYLKIRKVSWKKLLFIPVFIIIQLIMSLGAAFSMWFIIDLISPQFYYLLFLESSIIFITIGVAIIGFIFNLVTSYLFLENLNIEDETIRDKQHYKDKDIIKKRIKIASMFALVSTPFTFPIGPLIGFMYLIYVKRTHNKKHRR